MKEYWEHVSFKEMREWNCQLNISANRWLHCRMLRNLFLLNHMGKPEKSCIWSEEAQLYKSDWNRLSAFRFSVLSFSRLTFPLSALTPQHRNPSLCCPQRLYVLDHHSACAHTAVVVGLGNHWTLVIPLSSSTVGTSAEAAWRLSNALLSLRILFWLCVNVSLGALYFLRNIFKKEIYRHTYIRNI